MLHRVELIRSDPAAIVVRLLCHVLRAPHDPGSGAQDGPTHVYVGIQQAGTLEGRLYSFRVGEDEVGSVPATVPVSPFFATVSDPEDVSCANVPDDPVEAAEFQRRITGSLRDQLGVVQNYVATRSGSCALIAFNFPGPVTTLDREIVRMQALHVHFFTALASQIRETEEAFRYLINALARAAEAHDPGTGQHIVRVNRYAACLAKGLGLSEEFVDTIGYSAQLHDAGKVHIDQHIVRKTGRLEPEEVLAMRQHPTVGAHIIGPSPRLSMAREIALTHHERWDGSGYPNGLKGEAIPLSGRIVAVADVYDALRSARPYKPAYSHVDAMAIIQGGDGRTQPSHFDPVLLRALQACSRQLASIYEEFSGQGKG
jgi:HD-GYP domain-containing protein (c-di-GMP phosphodiesterase class II)